MRVYEVSYEYYDRSCILVRARSRNQARYIGSQELDGEYRNVQARVLKNKKALAYIQPNTDLSWGNTDLYRNILHYQEPDKEVCEVCDLTDFDDPKYAIEQGVCKSCKTPATYVIPTGVIHIDTAAFVVGEFYELEYISNLFSNIINQKSCNVVINNELYNHNTVHGITIIKSTPVYNNNKIHIKGRTLVLTNSIDTLKCFDPQLVWDNLYIAYGGVYKIETYGAPDLDRLRHINPETREL